MSFLSRNQDLGEVIFETYRQKHYIKVTAVHVKSGTEVSVLCPITATQEILQHVATSKLEYIMKRQENGHKRYLV